MLGRLAGSTDGLAWEDFVRQYGGLIRGTARRLGLQAADSDDVLQDVLVRLTRAMPGFEYDRGRGRFRGYLKTVVRHAISDRIGQNRGRPGVSTIDHDLPDPRAEADLDAVWEQQWRSYHVTQAMRTIEVEFGEIERLAFCRYAREGRPADEVAETLGISIDRVYQAKSRILRRLGALVAEQIRDEG